MIFGVFGGESFSDYYDLPNLSRDQVVYLQEIHFKNGYLKFNTSERNDLKFIPSNSAGLIASEQKLNNIELYNFSNQLVDKIVFHYKTNESRLTLEKISKINIINGIELPVLKFTYNPIRFTSYGLYNGNAYSTNAIDHWGYYNGINNNVTRIPPVSIPEYSKNLPGADRSISEMNVKAHMLERIDYSTGGFRLFDYESNDYTPSNGQAPSKDISETYDFFYEDGIFNVEPELITFTLTEATSIEIKKGIISVGPNRNWLLGTNSETTNTVLSAGIYNLRNLFKTNLLSMPNNSDIQTAYGSVNFSKKISTTNALGPGIRIKKITFHDGINTFSKRFIYKRENSILSSGALSVTPMYHTKMSVGTGASGYILSSNWLNDQTEDSPVGYSRVEEISDNNAKVIHYFSSYNDFPDEISISLNDHDEKLSSLVSNSYLRGRKKMEVFLDSLNHIVRKQVYTYKDVLERRKDITFLDVKTLFNKVLMTNNSPVGLVVEADMTLIQKSKVKSRFMVQSSFLKTDYFGNDSLVSVSNSFYDNPLNNYPRRIETKDSQGLHEVMLTTYPLDYVNEHIFGLDSLRSSRQLSLPIERVKYIFRNLQPDIVSGQLYEYYFDSRGLVKNIHGLETSSNIPLLLFKFSNGDAGILPLSSIPSIFLQDNRYKVSKQYLNYDSYGNPLAIKKTDGPVTSYLWGYNGQYPVAEIVNAHYNDVVSAIGGQSVVDALNSGTVTEDYIRQKMDILRSNLPGSQVTSYTYKPLVGMTSKIDAKGQTEYYQYDGLQRLQHVLDQFQQLRQSYHYHYRPQ
ncbi:Uncharacterised protein [Sphingobacterium spiritivorum]|uniref:RHS Repeat n=1 Tax=Sphingobacterium spiritivorum TaxID=258 RepID=A0A380BLK1_SPHSI|nr:hypothetical protein [Sphingobacterium spiritivorum]SUJ02408.1 Uncharacterised protein [Sphingobacterium spiritivorum]